MVSAAVLSSAWETWKWELDKLCSKLVQKLHSCQIPNKGRFSVTISLLETVIGVLLKTPSPLLPPQGEDEGMLGEQLEASPLFSVWGDAQTPSMTAKPLTLSSVANDQNFF